LAAQLACRSNATPSSRPAGRWAVTPTKRSGSGSPVCGCPLTGRRAECLL